MKSKLTLLLLSCFFAVVSNAQEKWNLKSVVEYAMENNLQVKQGEIQALQSKLNYDQSRASLIPDLNFSSAGSVNSGSNQDPINFNRITQTYFSTSFQLQTSTEIFNFFSKRNTILYNEWEWKAAKANVDKIKNDIALSAANIFLQILLSLEQEKIAEIQISQTSAQLQNTRRMVDVGTVPELNATQLEAQLALDSVNLVTAKGNTQTAILQLKSFMNIDAAAPFEVEAPPVELIPIESIGSLQPEFVYQTALQNQPLQKVNTFRLRAAEKLVAASKGNMLPSLTLFGTLASTYNNQGTEIIGTTQYIAPIGIVGIGGVNYDVLPVQPLTQYNYSKSSFNSQLSDNFRQSVGVGLSVPIFSGLNLKTAYRRNKLNVQSIKIQQDIDNLNLKTDIYNAYNDAVIALQKFNASQKNVSANETAFDFATRRMNVGMLSTFEWITIQNNLLNARLSYLMNHFDYVFKMKVLEFYKGQGLKL